MFIGWVQSSPALAPVSDVTISHALVVHWPTTSGPSFCSLGNVQPCCDAALPASSASSKPGVARNSEIGTGSSPLLLLPPLPPVPLPSGTKLSPGTTHWLPEQA